MIAQLTTQLQVLRKGVERRQERREVPKVDFESETTDPTTADVAHSADQFKPPDEYDSDDPIFLNFTMLCGVVIVFLVLMLV